MALQTGDLPVALGHLLDGVVGIAAAKLRRRLNLTKQDLLVAVRTNPELVLLGKDTDIWLIGQANLEKLQQDITDTLARHHASHPTSDGPGFEALHHHCGRQVDLSMFRLVLDLLVKAQKLSRFEGAYALASHRAGLTASQQKMADVMMAAIEATPFLPPRWDVKDADEKAIITFLEQRGRLVRVAPGLAFARSAYVSADQLLEAHLLANGDITAAQFRDLLGTSRKYALALLETFDRKGRTIRVGDLRKRGRPLADKP